MDSVLKLLVDGERLSTAQMASVLGLDEAAVEAELARLRQEKILLGWRPVLHPGAAAAAAGAEETVRAVIEVRITPERGGGFNRLAGRISRFDEVESCHLMSGSYDLLVFVRGRNLRQVASFVSERLSTIEGVLSTATHFLLRSYKEQGYLLEADDPSSGRLSVTP